LIYEDRRQTRPPPQFELDWVAAGGRPASADAAAVAGTVIQAPPPSSGASEAQFLPSGPDQSEIRYTRC